MFRVPPESAADFGHHAECSVLNLFAADDFVALGLEAPATGDYKLGCKISLPRISLEAHTTSAFEIPGLLSARNPLGLTVSESTITYPGGGSVTFKQLAFFKLGGPGVTFSPENNAQIFAPIGFSPDQVRRLVPDILAATFGFQVRTTFHGVDEYGNPYQTIGAWIIQVSGLFERSPETGYQFTEKLRIPLIGTFEEIEPEYDPTLEAGYVAQVKEKLDALLLATPEVVGALKLKGFREGDPDLGSTGLYGLPALTPQFNVTATPFPTNPATVG
jgi:hypothetical protein